MGKRLGGMYPDALKTAIIQKINHADISFTRRRPLNWNVSLKDMGRTFMRPIWPPTIKAFNQTQQAVWDEWSTVHNITPDITADSDNNDNGPLDSSTLELGPICSGYPNLLAVLFIIVCDAYETSPQTTPNILNAYLKETTHEGIPVLCFTLIKHKRRSKDHLTTYQYLDEMSCTEYLGNDGQASSPKPTESTHTTDSQQVSLMEAELRKREEEIRKLQATLKQKTSSTLDIYASHKDVKS